MKNSHWNLLYRLSNTIFMNFLLKANQQFVEILPTTSIFQSHCTCNRQSCVIFHDREADRLGNTSFSLIQRISLQTFRKFTNSTIFSRSKPVFWRSSSLENCNTYVAVVNMKHSRKSKTQTGFNRTTIP